MISQYILRKMRSLKQLLKIFVTFVFSLWWGIMSFPAAAQPSEEMSPVRANTRVDTLRALSRTWEQAARENRARALQLARQHGWVVRQELPDGRIIELVGVDAFDRPLYDTTDNVAAADTISTDEVQAGGSAGLSLSGNGFTVGLWEAGGTALTAHREFQNLTSPTVSRVTQRDGTANSTSHATHVAGTLIARGADPNAKGMAPQAALDAYNSTYAESEMATAAANGLLVSNHSYGYINGWNGCYWYGYEAIDKDEDYLFGFYYSTTQQWDTIAFNAPYYLIVKSAGNDRDDACSNPTAGHFVGYPNWTTSYYNRVNQDGGSTGYDTINPRGNAKNIITVGAVNDIFGGYTSVSSVVMTAYSGWGPTDDGRIKPDITGNGQALYSTFNNFTTAYGSSSGTSMASPNVAGSLLLLQEYFNTLHGVPLRSATLKALVLHTADEAGHDGPDYQYGWGLMNTAAAAAVITENGNQTLIAEEALSQDANYTRNVTANGNEALVATIAWTDPPGTSPSLSLDPPNLMLVNDLDLRITDGSIIYYPWVLAPANPANAATTGDNFRDNVEQVKIASPMAGEAYTITVTHKDTLTYAPQAFSLIVTGIQPTPTMTPTPEPTITPTPEPTLTPTPMPTATPTPEPTVTPTPGSAENYLLWTR